MESDWIAALVLDGMGFDLFDGFADARACWLVACLKEDGHLLAAVMLIHLHRPDGPRRAIVADTVDQLLRPALQYPGGVECTGPLLRMAARSIVAMAAILALPAGAELGCFHGQICFR